ncbi:RNA-guided endonuclease TnpB family protein, partial [Microseira sp. BLCC-F43]
LRRCKPKKDDTTGIFLPNGQSKKKGLNRAIRDAAWNELILKIEYLAAFAKRVPEASARKGRN